MATINILGTAYKITKKKYSADPIFGKRNIDGYCDSLEKQIVYCDMATYPGWEEESKTSIYLQEKQTLRHEIVHAFLDESGLQYSSLKVEMPWSKNEEMVDWFALQGIKIYKAWESAGALD